MTVKFPASLLLIANVIVLIGLLATPMLWFLSGFLFDDPRSTRNPLVIGMALALWTYPITAGLGGYLALKSHKAGDLRKMLLWSLCAYSSIGLFLMCMAIAILMEALT